MSTTGGSRAWHIIVWVVLIDNKGKLLGKAIREIRTASVLELKIFAPLSKSSWHSSFDKSPCTANHVKAHQITPVIGYWLFSKAASVLAPH